MKAIGRMIKNMVLVECNYLTEKNIKVIGSSDRKKEEESIYLEMVTDMKEDGVKAKEKALGDIFGQMVLNILDNGDKVK